MPALTTKPATFNSHAHIPIDEPLKTQLSSLKSDASIQQLDQFYLAMLEQLSPVSQKRRYLKQQNKAIQCLFRIDDVLVAVFYTDNTIQCFNQTVESLIEAISHAPLSVGRISFILQNNLSDHLTLEYYSSKHPTYQDLTKGLLYNKADFKAGFRVDETSLEELMCSWLQQYQQWMQDYLYFNLAQVSTEKVESKHIPIDHPAQIETVAQAVGDTLIFNVASR